ARRGDGGAGGDARGGDVAREGPDERTLPPRGGRRVRGGVAGDRAGVGVTETRTGVGVAASVRWHAGGGRRGRGEVRHRGVRAAVGLSARGAGRAAGDRAGGTARPAATGRLAGPCAVRRSAGLLRSDVQAPERDGAGAGGVRAGCGGGGG